MLIFISAKRESKAWKGNKERLKWEAQQFLVGDQGRPYRKLPLEKEPEEGEGVGHVGIWEKLIWDRGNVIYDGWSWATWGGSSMKWGQRGNREGREMVVGGQIMDGLVSHWNGFNSYFQLNGPLGDAEIGSLPTAVLRLG